MSEAIPAWKLAAYEAGNYVMKARYLTGDLRRWTPEDWCRYIDQHGAWTYRRADG